MDSTDSNPIKEYRVTRGFVWIALVGMALSLSSVIGGTLVAGTDTSVKEAGWLLLLTNATGGLFFVLSLYLLTACYREKLSLYSWGFRKKGVFGTKNISFSDVDKLVWEPATGTVAIVSSVASKTRIYLRNYDKVSRQEIIAFLREKLPEKIHQDWLRFLQYNAPESAAFTEHQKQLWKRKAWFAVFVGMVFLGFGAAFLIMENPEKKWTSGHKEAIVAINWGGSAILFLSAANHWRKNHRKK